jgi:ankyrin repeat protein
LVETDGGLESVMMADNFGYLPIHLACCNCNLEAAKYLHPIYPESINIADNYGFCPLHCVLWNSGPTPNDNRGDLIRFMLTNDQGAVSKPTRDGGLALHLACESQRPLEIVKLVYNKHPQAIYMRENDGSTPLDVCHDDSDGTRTFLGAQLEWERQAREQRQPDEQRQLPIHRLLQSHDVPVGTVELMIAANSDSATACDNKNFLPLHYACKFGHVDAVKFLVDFDEESIKEFTVSGELPLHIACREGKCSTINYILEMSDCYGISSCNKYGKLPIDLLLGANVNQDSLEYVEAMYRLLRAHPGVLGCAVANGGDSNDGDRSIRALSSSLKTKYGSIR